MKLVVPLSVFVVVYVVYYLTAFSSVTGGDSGELLAEACVSNGWQLNKTEF